MYYTYENSPILRENGTFYRAFGFSQKERQIHKISPSGLSIIDITAIPCLTWFLWHEKNHVMQVLYIYENFHSMIKSCYASFYKYKEDMHAKNNHAMENHVRWGIALHDRYITIKLDSL